MPNAMTAQPNIGGALCGSMVWTSNLRQLRLGEEKDRKNKEEERKKKPHDENILSASATQDAIKKELELPPRRLNATLYFVNGNSEYIVRRICALKQRDRMEYL